jgi:hypothetical protein
MRVRAALRGANWDNGANGRAGFALNLNESPSNRWNNNGFRAALPNREEPVAYWASG